MRTLFPFSSQLLTFVAFIILTTTGLAGDPGEPFPLDGAVNGQKAGSILFYNIYTSSASSPAAENTLINITNTSSSSSVIVHLFFVDGATCSPADFVLCMSPNLTFGFRASELDPGTSGYIMAVALNENGCPIIHNALIGDEYVRFVSGHAANLQAEAVAAHRTPSCNDTSVMTNLNFNGIDYDRLPSVLA
ncbi:MAG: hypothetical protein L0220_33005, partial [Acidobacteria bacterium]|nr:hypothetical protein [Acidobacteriota bacterium]